MLLLQPGVVVVGCFCVRLLMVRLSRLVGGLCLNSSPLAQKLFDSVVAPLWWGIHWGVGQGPRCSIVVGNGMFGLGHVVVVVVAAAWGRGVSGIDLVVVGTQMVVVQCFVSFPLP